MLSRTHAGPGRTVKQEQEEISPNHIQRLNLISVQRRTYCDAGRKTLHKWVHSFTKHSKTTQGLSWERKRRRQFTTSLKFPPLILSSPKCSGWPALPRSKVVLQECSAEICPAEWGNAMQRLPQMRLENIHGYFFCTRDGTVSHKMSICSIGSS